MTNTESPAPAAQLPAIGTRVRYLLNDGRGTVTRHVRAPFRTEMVPVVRDDANGCDWSDGAGRWVPLSAEELAAEEEAKRVADAAARATAYDAPAESCGTCTSTIAADGTCGPYCPEADLVDVEPAEEPATDGPMVLVPAAELERLQAIEAAAQALVEVVVQRTAQGWRKTPMRAVVAVAEALGD